jgi:hypothetical protein
MGQRQTQNIRTSKMEAWKPQKPDAAHECTRLVVPAVALK